MLHPVQCDDLLVFDDHLHQAPQVLCQNQVFWTILLQFRLILKTMMSGAPHLLRRKSTSKHPPSWDLLPHQDLWQPQWHLNPTSPFPTSKRGLKGMQVPTPSSRMKGITTPSFATSRQTAKAQGLNSLMDPNFTPGSDEYEQQLFQDQQDFLYSVLISSVKPLSRIMREMPSSSLNTA